MAGSPVWYQQSDVSLFVFTHLRKLQSLWGPTCLSAGQTCIDRKGGGGGGGGGGASWAGDAVASDVGEVVVELAQVGPPVVHGREDAAAGQLGEILGGEKGKVSAGAGKTGPPLVVSEAKGVPSSGVCRKRPPYPGGEVLPGKTRPPVAVLLPGAALALFPQAVKVGMQQQLLAGQPLRRVHPQTTLKGGNHGNHPHHRGRSPCLHQLKRPLYLHETQSLAGDTWVFLLQRLLEKRHLDDVSAEMMAAGRAKEGSPSPEVPGWRRHRRTGCC